MDKTKFIAWSILASLSIIWGSSFILIKYGLTVFTPDEVAALRISTAGLSLLPLAIKQFKKVQKKHYLSILGTGFLGSLIPSFLFSIAQTEIQSSLAGILNALTPFSTLLVGIIIYKQKTNRATFIGLSIALFGTILLISSGAENNFPNINYYSLLIILATICYGLNANIVKFKLNDLSTLAITSTGVAFVGLLGTIYILFSTNVLHKLNTNSDALYPFIGLSLLGIIGTALAWILFNKLIKLTSPVFTTSVTYIIPIIAVLWGLWDSEVLLLGHFLGMVVIIFGVYLSNLKKKSNAVPEKAP
jgi:drug/metabolite transporter (DMT)-like permease